jgi:hypothetical protein
MGSGTGGQPDRAIKKRAFPHCIVILLIWGALSPWVWQKQPNFIVGTKKTYPVQIPTIHGLSMLRDAHNFPVFQSKLLVALFGTTFSFQLTVPDMSMLHEDRMRQRSDCTSTCLKDIHMYNTSHDSLVSLSAPSSKMVTNHKL